MSTHPDQTGRIEYDQQRAEATFKGPGGFTQQRMGYYSAEAIARALGIEFCLVNERERAAR